MPNATPRLIIDREIHRLIHPMPDSFRVSEDCFHDRERKRRQQWRETQRHRRRAVEHRILRDGRVPPFEVWMDDREHPVLIDGRHAAYAIARQHGLSYETIELSFADRESAVAHAIERTLLHDGQPQLSIYTRVTLAAKSQLVKQLAEGARKNQGQRNDLSAHAPKGPRINTRKSIAALAGCGETTVGQVRKLRSEGELYFEKQRWLDIKNALLVGDMAVRQAHKKLEEEIKSAKELAALEDESASENDSKSTNSNHPPGPQTDQKKPDPHFPYENADTGVTKDGIILCGPNHEQMAKLDSGCASLIFGSPPYPVDKRYNEQNYRKPIDQWLEEDIGPVVEEADRLLRPGGRLIINAADIFLCGDEERRGPRQVSIFAALHDFVLNAGCDFVYREKKIWLKFIEPQKAPLGSVGTPANPHGYINHEFLIVFSKGDGPLPPPQPDTPSGMTRDRYRQWSTAEWLIAPVSRNKHDHPCPFPEPLADRVIQLYSWPTDLVIDPWVGSGTTTAVAARCRRRWIGIDAEESYCRAAWHRTKEEEQTLRKRTEQIRAKSQD